MIGLNESVTLQDNLNSDQQKTITDLQELTQEQLDFINDLKLDRSTLKQQLREVR